MSCIKSKSDVNTLWNPFHLLCFCGHSPTLTVPYEKDRNLHYNSDSALCVSEDLYILLSYKPVTVTLKVSSRKNRLSLICFTRHKGIQAIQVRQAREKVQAIWRATWNKERLETVGERTNRFQCWVKQTRELTKLCTLPQFSTQQSDAM